MKQARQPPQRLLWGFCCFCLGLMALTTLPGSIPRARAARVIPLASPIAKPDPPQHLNLAAAWGTPPIQRLPTQVDEGHRFVFGEAVTEDGKWLVGSIEPRLIFAATNETPVIALYNIETREILRLHATRTPRTQLLGAASDGDWVVWSEATDVLVNADWTMYAYNVATKQITQLAQANQLSGEVMAGTMPYPVYGSWSDRLGAGDRQVSNGPATVSRARARHRDWRDDDTRCWNRSLHLLALGRVAR